MENKFNFHSIKTGEQNAFSLIYIPNIIALFWAAIIIINFAKNGHIFPILLFILVYIVIMGLFWPAIWRPYLEFNQNKKEIQTKFPLSVWATSKVEIEKIFRIKEKKLHQEIGATIVGCIGGCVGGIIAGLCAGLILGLTLIGIKYGILGGILLGAVEGFGAAFVQPGDYVTYTLVTKKEKSKDQKSEDSKIEYNEYVIYIENKDDIQPFENFLQDCLSYCNRNDVSIEDVGVSEES